MPVRTSAPGRRNAAHPLPITFLFNVLGLTSEFNRDGLDSRAHTPSAPFQYHGHTRLAPHTPPLPPCTCGRLPPGNTPSAHTHARPACKHVGNACARIGDDHTRVRVNSYLPAGRAHAYPRLAIARAHLRINDVKCHTHKGSAHADLRIGGAPARVRMPGTPAHVLIPPISAPLPTSSTHEPHTRTRLPTPRSGHPIDIASRHPPVHPHIPAARLTRASVLHPPPPGQARLCTINVHGLLRIACVHAHPIPSTYTLARSSPAPPQRVRPPAHELSANAPGCLIGSARPTWISDTHAHRGDAGASRDRSSTAGVHVGWSGNGGGGFVALRRAWGRLRVGWGGKEGGGFVAQRGPWGRLRVGWGGKEGGGSVAQRGAWARLRAWWALALAVVAVVVLLDGFAGGDVA
ncbi:hypothetical protein PLICRDRAFT_179504 [Plicaturopsis crispa FD-325 SS-3]|uniref:Unplaced genomic scaffold PLICRscaffold_17, whole genome shotgun sequence n=1 Tax=Plicaturopsis crispa FD-325 SS-3 TaxID=944288 RepID=A0A0C9SRI9_PLICR|nr:hypothetical protein PLICRDRAFT_179504 [Plicaturopsis crispa FD-325 SS-3]